MSIALREQLLSKIIGAGFSERELDWLTAMHGLISTPDAPVGHVELLNVVLKSPDFFSRKPETLDGNVERSAPLLGLTRAQFVAAGLKHLPLLAQKPETLNANVERSAAQFGLTRTQFIAVALKHPPLFSLKPETLDDNVERSAALLGLTRVQFVGAALKHPPLFYLKPETLNANVERSATLLGLTRTQFVAVALKQSRLFARKPETLNDNVERSAALLGLTRTQFLGAALKQPQLFSRKPEKLNENVERSATLLGLTRTQFVGAALKQPQLFYLKPETLNGKKPYIMRIAEAVSDPREFSHLALLSPVALGRSRKYLHARYVVAKLDLKRGAFSTIINGISNARATGLIVDHFQRQIERTGTGVRALQVMHAQGLITTLPIGIASIERPPRRPRGTPDPRPLPPR